MGTPNAIEMWLLTAWFVFFAWAGGFEILRHGMPASVAAVVAVATVFPLLHAGPALVGMIPGVVRPAAVRPASIRRRAWWCEEFHLWAATAYAAFSQFDAARWIFRLWLALAALNLAAFLVLSAIRALAGKPAHA